jgi:hypothetical protein
MTSIELQGSLLRYLYCSLAACITACIMSKILASPLAEKPEKLTYFQHLKAEQSTEQRATIEAIRGQNRL